MGLMLLFNSFGVHSLASQAMLECASEPFLYLGDRLGRVESFVSLTGLPFYVVGMLFRRSYSTEEVLRMARCRFTRKPRAYPGQRGGE